ncbi:MAG: type II toxin-antitoxin system RelE family toxin [Terriglobia bacterium]
MLWTVSFEPRALRELEQLDRIAQRRVVRFLQERVAGNRNPRDLGKPLTGDLAGLWRYRIGEFRIVCRIDDDRLTVLVIRVAHRKDVYR